MWLGPAGSGSRLKLATNILVLIAGQPVRGAEDSPGKGMSASY